MISILALHLLAATEANSGFANCDFERGVEGWSVWYSDDPKAELTRYPWTADTTVARGGKQSLRIDAPDEDGRAFVMRTSAALKRDARYEASWWLRKSADLDESRFSVRFILRPEDPAKSTWKMSTAHPIVFERKTEGEWHFRRGYFRITKEAAKRVTLGLYLNEARGTIWIDDVRIREVDPEANRIADLFLYDPHRVELGQAPLRKFKALREAKSPLLALAQRYNRLLVDQAFAKEDVRRCLRAAHYVGREGVERVASAMETAERDLAKLYRAYGAAFLDGGGKEATESFTSLAQTVESTLNRLRSHVRASQAVSRSRASVSALLDADLPAISPDGRVNQIIFGNRSMHIFQEMEGPLRFDPVHSTTVGGPRSTKPGQYDWTPYEQQWAEISASGIPKKSCLLLFMVLHDGCYMPGWLWQRAKQDPEILHPVQEGTLRRRGNRGQLNWWHPDVQAYARETVSDMGRHFRDRDEFLFYGFQWECYGPYVATDKGTREVGYGKHAEAAFHKWLKGKYDSIAALNRRWQAEYDSFDAIEPPAGKYVVERQRTRPLEGEWEAWREQSYTDWCKLIYQAWKAADPNKPVLAGHSGLFKRFSMPDVYDTCDLLGFHCGAPDQMIVTLLINSMSRYNGHKPVCQYENFWGIQEHHDRMYEELPQRHSAQKYAFRLTVWNRFLQVWWYSYTPASYLTHYDGNYFDPSYALTTLRYRTAGLPVYFEKFRRLQRVLLDSRIVPSRICMLSPTASMRNNFPYSATLVEVRALFKELFPRNYLFEFVPEEYFLDGRAKLDDFDVLILPYALYLAEELQSRIGQWLEGKPRLLLSAGPFGLYDEIGCDSGTLFSRVFAGRARRPSLKDSPLGGLTFASPKANRWQWVDDAQKPSDLIEAEAGPSEVVVFLKPSHELARAEGFGEKLVQRIETATDRPVYDDRDAFEVVLRERGKKRYLCVINPSIDDGAASTVRVRGTFSSAVDLDYDQGYPIPARVHEGETVFPLRLEPGEATIIRLE